MQITLSVSFYVYLPVTISCWYSASANSLREVKNFLSTNRLSVAGGDFITVFAVLIVFKIIHELFLLRELHLVFHLVETWNKRAIRSKSGKARKIAEDRRINK